MGIALVASMRSGDPCCQVGACIKDSRERVVGIGYNGVPIDFSPNDSWENGITYIEHHFVFCISFSTNIDVLSDILADQLL